MENNVIISIQESSPLRHRAMTPSSWSRRACLEPDGDDGYPELSGERAHRPGGHLTTFQIERDGSRSCGWGGQLPDGL